MIRWSTCIGPRWNHQRKIEPYEFFTLLEEVYEKLDEGKALRAVDVGYLDFAKAFDKVSNIKLGKR